MKDIIIAKDTMVGKADIIVQRGGAGMDITVNGKTDIVLI